MSKLRIFIEGKELDSLESVTVPITKQFEELSDPTMICNDYSKTVTVPLSKNNNDIFGHCYNPDRLIAAGDDDTPLVGIYFDPYKKLDCRLQWGDDVFFTGYAKMLKVTNKGYEVTINGELGKIFQELQKITFDKSKYEDEEDVAKYWIDGAKYVNTQINKELVYKCWNSEQDDYTLRETTDSNYDITDIIGFIPNNSYSNDFDYKTVELSDGTSQSMSDVLGEDFETNTGYSRESVIGDGLMPVQMSQFRSYEQIPFIYWSMFWQIFQAKAEELTGYAWELGSEWFRDSNKNYNGLGITLLQRDCQNFATDTKTDSGYSLMVDAKEYAASSKYSDMFRDISVSETTTFIESGYNLKIAAKPAFTIRCTSSSTDSLPFGFKYFIDSDSDMAFCGGLIAKFYYSDGANASNFLNVGFCDASGYAMAGFEQLFGNAVDAFYGIDKVTKASGASYVDFSFAASDILHKTIKNAQSSGRKITCKFYFKTYRYFASTKKATEYTGTDFAPFAFADDYTMYQVRSGFYLFGSALDFVPTFYKTQFRSGDTFTLNDICRLDFSNILDYCKRFRINIAVDEVAKKLKFSRSPFANSTIIDKTDKVDSSTFDVSPITFDSKFVLFGYAEKESQLGKTYKSLYGYPYGAKRFTTYYNFNSETDTLFENSCETIIYSPAYLYWGDLILCSLDSSHALTFLIYNNNYLECRDEDGKTIDVSGAYFYPTKKKIDRFWSVRVSDDSTNQKLLDTYCYYRDSVGLDTLYWTSPELVMADELVVPTVYYTCLWTLPKKNYIAQADYFSRLRGGIFESFWQTYLNERYNTQNKKVTTYVRLSPSDFINFDFGQFWKIGNQLYAVNKIYDYDITSDKPTKVDLITIQDVNAYK